MSAYKTGQDMRKVREARLSSLLGPEVVHQLPKKGGTNGFQVWPVRGSLDPSSLDPADDCRDSSDADLPGL